MGGIPAGRAIAFHPYATSTPEIIGEDIVIVRDHDCRAVPHQLTKCLAEFPPLGQVVFHSLRNLRLGQRPEHRTAIIVLIDLIAGEENQIRIVRDQLGNRFLPGPGDVLVAGEPGQFEDRTGLWLRAKSAVPRRIAAGHLEESPGLPRPGIEREQGRGGEPPDGFGPGVFPIITRIVTQPQFHRLGFAFELGGRVRIQMHQQLHLAKVLAVLAPEDLRSRCRGSEQVHVEAQTERQHQQEWYSRFHLNRCTRTRSH